MDCEPEKESMDIDSPEEGKESPARLEKNGSEEGKESPARLEKNGLHLYPVSAHDSGIGLPYAPEDWPNPGDKWRWRVGKRITSNGLYVDRYMFLPTRLRDPAIKRGFASKLSLEQYIRAKFPDADVSAFFASFSWRIPSKPCKKDGKEIVRPRAKPAESNGLIGCKVGNTFCSSLAAGDEPASEVMSCDICCSEPGFCRNCCCILCCQTIASEGYSFIRCVANIEGRACGHSCHIDCALRSYMIGTVDGAIGLDAEYYCRRCDLRSDLVSYVAKLLQKCESNVSREEIEMTLSVGDRLLSGAKRPSAKRLLHHIQLAMSKLKNGTRPEDIWKKDDVSADSAGVTPKANDALISLETEESQGGQHPLSSNFDSRVESLKLDNEIDEILDALRKSQQIEYRLAEERLTAQKNCVINLFEQLDRERSILSRYKASNDHDSLLDSVLNSIEQVKREVTRLKDMREVANGFGRVPKRILEEHFGL